MGHKIFCGIISDNSIEAREFLDKIDLLSKRGETTSGKVSDKKTQEGNIPLKQIELATDKQKWRMKQLNIKFNDRTTKFEAHNLISEKIDGAGDG